MTSPFAWASRIGSRQDGSPLCGNGFTEMRQDRRSPARGNGRTVGGVNGSRIKCPGSSREAGRHLAREVGDDTRTAMDQLGCREQGLPSLPVPAGAHPAAGAGHQGHVPGTVKGAAPDIAAIPDPPSCRYPAVHPFRTSRRTVVSGPELGVAQRHRRHHRRRRTGPSAMTLPQPRDAGRGDRNPGGGSE